MHDGLRTAMWRYDRIYHRRVPRWRRLLLAVKSIRRAW